MRARPTGDDLLLALGVGHLVPPGGSVTVADLASHLGRQVQVVTRLADGAERRGVAYRYTHAGSPGWAVE